MKNLFVMNASLILSCLNRILALAGLLSAVCALLANMAQAGSGTGHHSDPDALWQLDVRLGWRDVESEPLPGFLPYEQHVSADGFGLDHLDLTRAIRPSLRPSGHGGQQWTPAFGRISLSQHEGELELSEAWLAVSHGNAEWSMGQQLVDVGWQNGRHLHELSFVDRPRVYQALWGADYSEPMIRYQDWGQLASQWEWQFQSALLSTQQMNTQQASGAGLLSLTVGWHSRSSDSGMARAGKTTHRPSGWQVKARLDAYQAAVHRRALDLFDDGEDHSHGGASESNEYFDGKSRHWILGFSTGWHQNGRGWTLDGEYQRRRDWGQLGSQSTETTNAAATLDLTGWGSWVALVGHYRRTELGVRWQQLGSDVQLTDLATGDLESSVLNHQSTEPEFINWLFSYRLPPVSVFSGSGSESKLLVEFTQVIGVWARKEDSGWVLLWQQSQRF